MTRLRCPGATALRDYATETATIQTQLEALIVVPGLALAYLVAHRGGNDETLASERLDTDARGWGPLSPGVVVSIGWCPFPT